MKIGTHLLEDGVGELNQFSGHHDSPNSTVLTVPEYAQYTVTVRYVEQTPEFGEYYPPLDGDDDYRYEPFVLTVNFDGTVQSFTSGDAECDEFGLCFIPAETAWEEEECSLLAIGGCVRNALHYFMEWLGITPTASNPTGSPFLAFQTNTHGLTAVVTAPLYIFSNMSNGSYTCSTLTLPVPYTESNITLPCMYEFYQNTFGALFTMYQTIISGIISYYVIVRLLETVKNAKDPHHDRIEVTQL